MTTADYLNTFAALVFVLALMGGMYIVLRKFNLGHTGAVRPPKSRRLTIEEVLPIDSRRKAVLLRRDDKQHLVILSTSGETVIETAIDSPQPQYPDHGNDQHP
jgi:flagellar protein FliO/FliZ